ncbi:hypothetical protein [Rhodococcus globerulus]|uniref:Uncharacterized protein n=1 Tax=Rhodococcus globerulus TaxID=33008 RepID=A0ABU4C6B0_RHOGO|nr:hypothetical protein [Rhodococcus globerulus]MDV6271809.1 hypothetical protein [Rhodococcus globerulus]
MTLHLVVDAYEHIAVTPGDVDDVTTTFDAPLFIWSMPQLEILVEDLITLVAGHSHRSRHLDRLRGRIASDQLDP